MGSGLLGYDCVLLWRLVYESVDCGVVVGCGGEWD